MSDEHGHGDGSAVEAAHPGEHDGSGHDDDAHGHGDDPNAGVTIGTPPTPAWVLAATLIGLVTLIAAVWLAVAMGDVPSTGRGGNDAPVTEGH